jgi:hypothetical protein
MSAQLNNSEIRKMSDNQPVLCIPGVFANIKEERIRRIFGDLNLGEVDRVDIVVPKRPVGAEEKENKFNRVFVHLIWNDTPSSVACRKKLTEGKEVKIIYDEPWFWRVSAYRPPAPKPRFESQQPKKFQPKKATLELDFEQVAEVKYSGIIAPGIIVPEVIAPAIIVPEIIAPAIVMNPDIRLMVATFLGIGRDDVTEEQYKNNAQFVRDLRQDDMDRQKDEDAAAGIKPLNYGNLPPAPKKKNRLIVEETKTDKEEK